MKVYASSDIGNVRENNQDYYFIPLKPEDLKLYILADGMGGCNGGEIASSFATRATREYIEKNFYKIAHEKDDIIKLIKDALAYANDIVYRESKLDENLSGMGTTIDVCLIYGGSLYIGHIGDSRVYRIRKNILRRLTTDHSYVEKLIKDGTITREEAKTHPKKNMLMKALGCTPKVEPDVLVSRLQREDVLLMTSDGLTNMVSEEEIYETVINGTETAVTKLISKAKENGGIDNITVVIVENR